MTVETNVPLDSGAMAIPSQFVNRVQVLASGPNLRMAFGEGFAGSDITYRSAVTMTIQDAKEVAQVILATLDAHIAKQADKVEQPIASKTTVTLLRPKKKAASSNR